MYHGNRKHRESVQIANYKIQKIKGKLTAYIITLAMAILLVLGLIWSGVQIWSWIINTAPSNAIFMAIVQATVATAWLYITYQVIKYKIPIRALIALIGIIILVSELVRTVRKLRRLRDFKYRQYGVSNWLA